MGLSAPIVGTPTLVNTGAASGTVVVPATAQAGDRLLLVIAYGGGGIPAVLGAGGVSGGAGGQWPALPTFPVGGTAPGTALDIRTGVCKFKDIGATLTVFFNTATAKAIMWVEAWRDPNGTPEINQASAKLASTATALTTNSITPSKTGCWVMSVFCNRGLTGGTFLPGTDSGSGGALTERDDRTNTGTSEVAAELCDTNATVSSGVATVHSSTSSATAAYCAGIVAIAPGSVFPTDQQIVSSQFHPGRSSSRTARFWQTPRSTDIAVAGEAHSGATQTAARSTTDSTGTKGGTGGKQAVARSTSAATGIGGHAGATQGACHPVTTATGFKGAAGSTATAARAVTQAAASKQAAGATQAHARSQSLATGAQPQTHQSAVTTHARILTTCTGRKGAQNATQTAARSTGTLAARKGAQGTCAASARALAIATALHGGLGATQAHARTESRVGPSQAPIIPGYGTVLLTDQATGTTTLTGHDSGTVLLTDQAGGTVQPTSHDTGTAGPTGQATGGVAPT